MGSEVVGAGLAWAWMGLTRAAGEHAWQGLREGCPESMEETVGSLASKHGL